MEIKQASQFSTIENKQSQYKKSFQKKYNEPIEPTQSRQNEMVKEELIKEMNQIFNSRETMVPYYMHYDFPEKMRATKAFWEELIQKVIKKKNQIYVTFKDLQTITHINSVRPSPLKAILKQLKTESVYIREQDLILQKRPPPPSKPWYTNILSIAWSKPTKVEPEWPFTFAPQEKIISWKIKQRKKRELIYFFQRQFVHENSRFMGDLVREISKQIKVDEVSVQLMLKELHKLREVFIGEVEDVGDRVVIFSTDRRKMLDDMFIRVQKMKCVLKWQMHKLQVLDDKSSVKIANLKQKAKEVLQNEDKRKGKVLIAQAVAESSHRQKIQVRIQIFQQKISQIELNQMNKSSIDLLQQAQHVYQEIAVDSEKFDQVMQKERELQTESQITARKFQQLAADEDVDEEVDRMMKEIQEDSRQYVEKKRVHVDLSGVKNQGSRIKPLIN